MKHKDLDRLSELLEAAAHGQRYSVINVTESELRFIEAVERFICHVNYEANRDHSDD